MICAEPANLKGHPVTDIEEDHMHCWVVGKLTTMSLSKSQKCFRGLYLGRWRRSVGYCPVGRDQKT